MAAFVILGEPQKRQRNVTICARVQMASGEKVVSEVPEVNDRSAAHCTLSAYHAPSGTSVKVGWMSKGVLVCR